LAAARRELTERNIRLILDFVPNHLALDHPWVAEHPEYFIQGNADGVRCDMAMLLLNSIFERTWGSRAGQKPAAEYWADPIGAVKKLDPEFLFIAEAYWDREWELQQQGFDFCYDKRLYDRLARGNAQELRSHLGADLGYQTKLLRFIENHDEQRAAAAFSFHKERVATVAMATVPGARLLHEGQLEGRKIKLPVFLRRRAAEPVNQALEDFYEKLQQVVNAAVLREGKWSLCECTGWPDNSSYQNLCNGARCMQIRCCPGAENRVTLA